MSPYSKKPVQLSADSDDDLDQCWTDSAIFAIGGMMGGDMNDEMPSIDLNYSRMDENQLRLAASVFSSAHDGIMITDARGVILDVNRAFTRMTGFSQKEVIGQLPAMLRSDVHPDDFYEDIRQILQRAGYWRGEITTAYRDGQCCPVLISISAVRDAFGEVTHYVTIFTDITALKESQQKLEDLAYFDALTHLPNRVLLSKRIKDAKLQAERDGKLLAVCLLDLDNFKAINDNYGHELGDELLIELARRLSADLRPVDTLARLGGDEFALLLTDFVNEDEPNEVLSALFAKIREPIKVGALAINPSASMGYTLVPPDPSDADNLLRHADQAMYVAKVQGRDRFHRFDMEHDQRVRLHSENLINIQNALDADQFRLFYQPKVDMRHGKVVGVEALIRWQHPERGLLSPNEFLPAIGNHVLLADIGDWVIGQVVQQLADWQAEDRYFSISINIEGSHLLHPEFVTRLAGHLSAHPDVDPSYLELEILETAVIEDIEHISRVFGECHELGVQFALDDFGTAYSSLVYLKRLPVKTLKIDRSFVRGMLDDNEDMAIVSGILGLAKAFNREVVAEGVESVEHGIMLLHLHCDLAQGFTISPPMPSESFLDWAATYQSVPAWQERFVSTWRDEDLPLLAAPIEQQRWMEQVVGAIERGAACLPQNKISNLKESRFGRWLVETAAHNYPHLIAELGNINDLHRKAHRVSAQISVFLARGDVARATALLETQWICSNELISVLRELRRLIIQHNLLSA